MMLMMARACTVCVTNCCLIRDKTMSRRTPGNFWQTSLHGKNCSGALCAPICGGRTPPLQAIMAKRALVSGGAGLIGSHVVDLLVSQGRNVRAMDNLEQSTNRSGKPALLSSTAYFNEGQIS